MGINSAAYWSITNDGVVVAGVVVVVVVVEYYWFELNRKVNLWQTKVNQYHTDPSNGMEDEIFGYTEKHKTSSYVHWIQSLQEAFKTCISTAHTHTRYLICIYETRRKYETFPYAQK